MLRLHISNVIQFDNDIYTQQTGHIDVAFETSARTESRMLGNFAVNFGIFFYFLFKTK